MYTQLFSNVQCQKRKIGSFPQTETENYLKQWTSRKFNRIKCNLVLWHQKELSMLTGRTIEYGALNWPTIARVLCEIYNNFWYSILGHPNCHLAGASSSSKLYWLISMYVLVLFLAHWISRNCVLLYGKWNWKNTLTMTYYKPIRLRQRPAKSDFT